MKGNLSEKKICWVVAMSISLSVFMSLPPMSTRTAVCNGDFWSKSAFLKLQNSETLFFSESATLGRFSHKVTMSACLCVWLYVCDKKTLFRPEVVQTSGQRAYYLYWHAMTHTHKKNWLPLQKKSLKKNYCIGSTIGIGLDFQCLYYVRFFKTEVLGFFGNLKLFSLFGFWVFVPSVSAIP